jgi:hypothetical protein
MNTFEAVVALVQTKYQALLPDEETRFFVGEPKRHEHNSPNRFVFVSNSGTFEPPHTGGSDVVTENAELVTEESWEPVAQRVFDVEIDVHGRDEAHADALLRNVYRALHLTLGPRGFTPRRWEEISPKSVNKDGTTIRLSCEIRTLLTAEPEKTLVVVTSHDHTDIWNGEEVGGPHEEAEP